MLVELGCLHGLNFSSDVAIECVQHSLLQHLICGDCFRSAKQNASLPRGSRQDIVCGALSFPFPSATDMSLSFVRCVLDDIISDQKLTIKKVSSIASAVSNEAHDSCPFSTPNNVKRDAVAMFNWILDTSRMSVETSVIPSDLEKMSKSELQCFAASHSISFDRQTSVSALLDLILKHATLAACLATVNTADWDSSPPGCAQSMSLKPLCRVLNHLAVPYNTSDSLNRLHQCLTLYVSRMQKLRSGDGMDNSWEALFRDLVHTRENWPQLIPSSSKHKIRENFLSLMGSSALRSDVCASCSKSCSSTCLQSIRSLSIDLNLLCRPDAFESGDPFSQPWLSDSVFPPVFPFNEGPLADILVDPKGVKGSGAETELLLCKSCPSSLCHGWIPDLALSNHMFLGDVPPELKDLTVVEESMIALCRAKCCILRLKADSQELARPTAQHALKGNLIVYPQKPSDITKKLPPSIEEIISPICILFVGAYPPSNKWLRDKAKPLAVHAHKVRCALLWLKSHNHLYKDIETDDAVLNELEDNPVLPFHVEHVANSCVTDISTSAYDLNLSNDAMSNPDTGAGACSNNFPLQDHNEEVPFPGVVITEIENAASSSQMAAAAICHLRKKGGSFLQIPHDPKPVNEFFNPTLFPMIYPTLYPYGIGGFKDDCRRVKVSMQRHVKHLFSLYDRHFQEHYSFLFAAFNILQ